MGHHDTFDWLTLGAAYIGVFGLVGGVIRYGSQVRDKRRGQAQHVFAWFEPSSGEGRLVVRNRSEWPIADVDLIVPLGTGEPARFHVGLIDCGDDHHEPWPRSEDDQSVAWTAIDIQFTDASGRRWHRPKSGELQRLHSRRWLLLKRTFRRRRREIQR